MFIGVTKHCTDPQTGLALVEKLRSV